ncbi:MAG: DUF2993 domain-containing protein [Chloroflexaceae bacterium]|nr:DUF2993 domain-containing protein [Chloroflexaceae bacterium]
MNTPPDPQSLGHNALDRVLETGIETFLEAVETLEVKLDGNLLQLLQGQVNSLALHGEELVAGEGFSLEAIALKTDNIAINWFKVLLGKLELTHPTTATLRLVIGEGDLNRAIQSDWWRNWLREQALTVAGESLSLCWQTGEIRLPDRDRLFIEAQLLVCRDSGTRPVAFAITLQLIDGEFRFEQGHYEPDRAFTLDETVALLTLASRWLNQRQFQGQGLSITCDRLAIEPQQLILWLQTTIQELSL